MVGATWIQASEYCEYIQSRLPTEAEWELAARGSEENLYPWGEEDPSCSLLNYADCLDPSAPEDVRSYPDAASEFKAMDMAGNVFEWVNDWYADDYYPTSPESNPVGPADGTKKVYRGGSYASTLDDINPVARFALKPDDHSAEIGFRCVLTTEGYNTNSQNGGTGSQVPRLCQALPLNVVQMGNQATMTPIPCEPPTITGNCYINSQGNAITNVLISQSNCQSNMFSKTGSYAIPDLNCSEIQSNNGKSYLCDGSNMFQGSTVDIGYCHYYDITQKNLDFVCPAGYQLGNYGMCFAGDTWLPSTPCPNNYVEIEGFCFPHTDQDGKLGCPPGYLIPWSDPTICIPLDNCLLKGNFDPCEPPVCPAGQIYDPNGNCCGQ